VKRQANISRGIGDSLIYAQRSKARLAGLLLPGTLSQLPPEMGKGFAQRSAGNLNQSSERFGQFQDKENRSRDR
jgi:hypothetical protein